MYIVIYGSAMNDVCKKEDLFYAQLSTLLKYSDSMYLPLQTMA